MYFIDKIICIFRLCIYLVFIDVFISLLFFFGFVLLWFSKRYGLFLKGRVISGVRERRVREFELKEVVFILYVRIIGRSKDVVFFLFFI